MDIGIGGGRQLTGGLGVSKGEGGDNGYQRFVERVP